VELPPDSGHFGIDEIRAKQPELLVGSRELLDSMPPIREAGNGDEYGLVYGGGLVPSLRRRCAVAET